jgi:hypothetical protein
MKEMNLQPKMIIKLRDDLEHETYYGKAMFTPKMIKGIVTEITDISKNGNFIQVKGDPYNVYSPEMVENVCDQNINLDEYQIRILEEGGFFHTVNGIWQKRITCNGCELKCDQSLFLTTGHLENSNLQEIHKCMLSMFKDNCKRFKYENKKEIK